MHKTNINMRLILKILLLFFLTLNGFSQEKLTQKSLKEGLFQLNEIDMHFHAGKERPFSLNEWIDLSVKKGIKVMLLLDHLELYRMDSKEHEDWLKEKNFTNWYPNFKTGKTDFMNEMENAKTRDDVITFRGWEIWEGEFEEGLEKDAMKLAEVIGWHMSRAAWDGKDPAGRELIYRAKQIVNIQKEFPIPMIIFHPFYARIKSIKKAAVTEGRNFSEIEKKEYRYFTKSEQDELIDVLSHSSVYIEISKDWFEHWSDPVVREAFIEDIRPLAERGVKFTVSTDAHHVGHLNEPYDPVRYCDDLGSATESALALFPPTQPNAVDELARVDVRREDSTSGENRHDSLAP